MAEEVKALGLRYAVLTSVDLDDLPDLGAGHWVQTVRAVKALCPTPASNCSSPISWVARSSSVRCLPPSPMWWGTHGDRAPTDPSVRSVARYDRSLSVLQTVTRAGYEAKTGFMVGLARPMRKSWN